MPMPRLRRKRGVSALNSRNHLPVAKKLARQGASLWALCDPSGVPLMNFCLPDDPQ
jgi:hypothetical protein